MKVCIVMEPQTVGNNEYAHVTVVHKEIQFNDQSHVLGSE